MPDPQQLDIGAEIAALDIGSELADLMSSHPKAPPMGTIGPDTRGPVQRGLETFSQQGPIPGAIVGGLKRADNFVRGTGDLMRAGWNLAAPESMEVDRPYLREGPAQPVTKSEDVGDKVTGLAEAYGTAKAGVNMARAVPELVKRGLGISSMRAAENLQRASEAARAVPLNVEKVGQEGLRAMELQQAGARMPRAATQMMRRITDPAQADLTFGEGRDFYSNLSRLSANEQGALNPTMQRQLIAMRQALHDALVGGAEQVGMGSQYAAGIKEYARAARAAQAAKSTAKWGAGLAGLGIGGNYVLDKLIEAAGRTSGTR